MATQNDFSMSVASVEQKMDKQAENLFINKTISEITQIEQKARLDIERKKEDLRQLVGERYRDMIESADSVISMKESTISIIEQLNYIHDKCRHVQQKHFIKGTGGQEAPPTVSSIQSVGAQIQLLIKLQEKIWVGLEKEQYLSVGNSYLLMDYIISRLRTMNIVWPRLLVHLWQQMSEISGTIIQRCHNYLQSVQLEDKVTMECLSVMLLLEKCDIPQLLHWFLEDRQVTINRLSHYSFETKSVKDTVIEIFQVLRHSLALIHDLFTHTTSSFTSTEGQSRLLLEVNEFVHSKKDSFSKELIPHHLLKSLPDYITGYRPSLSPSLSDINNLTIKTKTKEWLDNCVTNILSQHRLSLSHISTLKGLASLRNSIHSLLSTTISTRHITIDFRTEWDKITNDLLGEYFCLYDTYLKPALMDRAKEIIQSLLSEAHTNSLVLLDGLFQLYQDSPNDFLPDTDLTTYLWSWQSTGDNTFGRPLDVGSGNDEVHSSTEAMLLSLKMKSKGCTPQIYNFCQEYSNYLEGLFEGVQVFSLPPPSLEAKNSSCNNDYPFKWKNDLVSINSYLQESLLDCVEKFLTVVSSMVVKLSDENSSDSMNKILLLARLCKCLTQFSPNLKVLIDGTYVQPKSSSTKISSSMAGSSWRGNASLSKNKIQQTHKIYSLLEQKTNELHRTWCHSLSSTVTRQIVHSLNSELDSVSLATLVNWDEISITEESEKGQSISSTIYLPSQASLFLMTTLFALCQEIIRVGGHHIEKVILKELTMKVLEGVLNAYSSLLISEDDKVDLTQESSLQFLFDLQFVSSVLSPSGWQEEWASLYSLYSQLIDKLKDIIDPFDYDVFYPHMARMLDRQLQRSNVMLGVLVNIRGHPSTFTMRLQGAGSRPSTGHQEKHIVLPLSSQLPRLSSLPSAVNLSTGKHTSSLLNQWLEHRPHDYHVPSFINLTGALQHFH